MYCNGIGKLITMMTWHLVGGHGPFAPSPKSAHVRGFEQRLRHLDI